MKLLLISLMIQFAFATAFADKKKDTPDLPKSEDTCPSYGCDDATDDGSDRGGNDSVDGTDPGDDWWGGERGDGGGGEGSPDFTYTVQNNLVTYVEFYCVVGGVVVEFSDLGNEPLEVQIEGETVILHRRENTFAGENVMLMQRYDHTGKLTNSIYKTWPRNEALKFSFETSSPGQQQDTCQVTITPRR